MELNFNEIEARTDRGKVVPQLEHLFEYNGVLFTLEHLKPGDSFEAMTVSEDGISRISPRLLVQKKLKAIDGLTATFKDGTKKDIKTAEDLLGLPSSNAVNDMFLEIFKHLMATGNLSEEEEKNSSSATNA